MKSVFADTAYWIAIVKPGDSLAEEAKDAKAEVEPAVIVTTDDVLDEFLTAMRPSSGSRI